MFLGAIMIYSGHSFPLSIIFIVGALKSMRYLDALIRVVVQFETIKE